MPGTGVVLETQKDPVPALLGFTKYKMCVAQQIPLLQIKILLQVPQNVLQRGVYVSLFVVAIKLEH